MPLSGLQPYLQRAYRPRRLMAAGLARSLWIGGGTALAVLLVGIVWYDAQRFVPADAVPDLRDRTRIAAGEPIYRTYCAGCHGVNLEGQPDWTSPRANGRLPAPPHDDSGHTWHHPSTQLFAITKHGMVPPNAPPNYQSDMPAFAGVLSDEQIWAVLAYIQSRWSPEVRARHAALERELRQQQQHRH